MRYNQLDCRRELSVRSSLAVGFALSLAGSVAIASSANAQTTLWRITKTEWSEADEKGFGDFVAEIARSGCTTTVSCMRSAANLYHESDPASFDFHADCAKWVYMLRAYRWFTMTRVPASVRIMGSFPVSRRSSCWGCSRSINLSSWLIRLRPCAKKEVLYGGFRSRLVRVRE